MPKLNYDEWLEMVNVSRASFVLARQWIDKEYKDVFELINNKGKKEFEQITNCIFRDAVQNIASIWLKAWERYIQ